MFVDDEGKQLEARIVETSSGKVVEIEVPNIPSFGVQSLRIQNKDEVEQIAGSPHLPRLCAWMDGPLSRHTTALC